MTVASVNTSPASASTAVMSASPIRPRRRALANLARCSPSGPVPENEHTLLGLSRSRDHTRPVRVLDDVGQGAWHCTVRLVYGVLHGLALPVWRGDEI